MAQRMSDDKLQNAAHPKATADAPPNVEYSPGGNWKRILPDAPPEPTEEMVRMVEAAVEDVVNRYFPAVWQKESEEVRLIIHDKALKAALAAHTKQEG